MKILSVSYLGGSWNLLFILTASSLLQNSLFFHLPHWCSQGGCSIWRRLYPLHWHLWPPTNESHMNPHTHTDRHFFSLPVLPPTICFPETYPPLGFVFFLLLLCFLEQHLIISSKSLTFMHFFFPAPLFPNDLVSCCVKNFMTLWFEATLFTFGHPESFRWPLTHCRGGLMCCETFDCFF